MTSNPEMRKIIEQLKLNKETKNHDTIMTESDDMLTESVKVMQDKIRLDQIREEEIRDKNKDLSISAKSDDTDKIQDIFDFWRNAMNSPRSRLDENRKRLIRNALKKYTETDLQMAISGCSYSAFHMGQNPDA